MYNSKMLITKIGSRDITMMKNIITNIDHYDESNDQR